MDQAAPLTNGETMIKQLIMLTILSSSPALATESLDFSAPQECTLTVFNGYRKYSGTLFSSWEPNCLVRAGDVAHNAAAYDESLTLSTFLDTETSLYFSRNGAKVPGMHSHFEIDSVRQNAEDELTYDIDFKNSFFTDGHISFEPLQDRTLVHVYYGDVTTNFSDESHVAGLIFECVPL